MPVMQAIRSTVTRSPEEPPAARSAMSVVKLSLQLSPSSESVEGAMLTDRSAPAIVLAVPLTRRRTRSSTDRASDYGSEG